MKIIGVIQAHFRTFAGGQSMVLYKLNDGSLLIEKVIERLRRIDLLDEIVIAVPDMSENNIFDEIAQRHHIKCFKGNTNDVADRLLNCALAYNADIMVRVMGHDVIINDTQLQSMLDEVIKNKLDGAFFKNEIFHGGGWVVTTECMQRLKTILYSEDIRKEFHARPDGFIRLHSDIFNIMLTDAILPANEEVKKGKEFLHQALCEEGVTDVDFKLADVRDYSTTKYKLASSYLLPEHHVLDIACAYGNGTKLLSAYCQSIDGVDLAEYAIQHAIKTNNGDNIKYWLGDATHLGAPGMSAV